MEVLKVSLMTCIFVPSVDVPGLSKNPHSGSLSTMYSHRTICEVQSGSGTSMCIEKKVAAWISKCNNSLQRNSLSKMP